MAVDDRLEKVPQHLLGHIEIRDHAVFEGTDREDPVGRAPQHALRLETNAFDLSGGFLDRDHGGLVEHDALPLHVDEGIGRAEIDGDLVRRAPRSKLQVRPANGHRIVG